MHTSLQSPIQSLRNLSREHWPVIFSIFVLLAALAVERGKCVTASAAFVTITVTGTADGTLAALAGNGTCDLREAIQAANTNAAVGECVAGAAGLDTINFNLPGPGYTINVAAGGLQVITQPVVMEGAPFAGSTDRVELNGASAGAGVDGLRVTAGGSTLRTLVINRFTGDGIELNGSSGNVIEGCYLGTDLTGMSDQGNAQFGVNVIASTNNRVGGTTAAARNVISGNNFGGVQIDFGSNTVQGNYIGTNKDGEAALGNSGHGVNIIFSGATNNSILSNVISANASNGISAGNGATGTVVRGNLIGTDKDGDTDLGNVADGIGLGSGTNNIIGGTSPADRNVISGNNGTGLALGVQGVTVQGNYIGTNSAGTAALGNSLHGMVVGGNTTIGGTTGTTSGGNCTGACNLISGNGQNGIVSNGNTVVLGNFIGTDVTGNVDLGNVQSGIVLSNSFNGLTVGGTTPESRNVISGNNEYGVLLVGGGAMVQGNYIGLNGAGTNDLGNTKAGVWITNFSAGNFIGGTAVGAGNVISGNDEDGIYINASLFSGSTNTIQGNLIGTDFTGTLDRGNTRDGIRMATSFLIVGGATAAARNVVSGNNGVGISSVYPSGSAVTEITIQGNYIGTDINGMSGLGNTASGVYLIGGQNSLIGGTAVGEGNLIAANSHGIYLDSGTTNGPTVQGNLIGTDKNGMPGSPSLGNTANGIRVGQSNTTIGGASAAARNVIAYNGENGIQVSGSSTIRVAMRGNAISGNTKLGIDLAPTLPGGTVTGNDAGDGDGGPNLLQNFPVLNAITQPCTITGSLDSTTANAAYPVRIEFFANTACDPAGNGEGEAYLGFVALNAPGSFSFSFTPVAGKSVITATATDANGNTSEFSACQTAPINQPPVITPASLSRNEGQPGANTTIATITDINQLATTLSVTINGQAIVPSPTLTVNGVTISNLALAPAGALTADVVAACGATNASFTLAATDNCGVTTNAMLAVAVVAAPAPVINTPPVSQGVCVGSNAVFTVSASNVVSYQWRKNNVNLAGANTATLTLNSVTAADATNYDVVLTGLCNLMVTSQPATLSVNANPAPIITPSGPTTFCAGGSVMLTASAAISYLWSNGATTQSITVNAAGNYFITVTDGNGCQGTSAATAVTVNPLPTPTITPSGSTTFCAGGNVTLTASAANSYLWSNGATTQSITVNAAGNYFVTVTDGNGCQGASAATTVTVNPLPTPTFTASGATTFCTGGSVTLTASAASSYLWSSGATTQSITVNAAGSYFVTVTDGNACQGTSAATTVTVNPLPTPTITPSGPTTFCQGSNVMLTASAASSYLWSNGATTQSINVNAAGNYFVTVTDGNGCQGTSAATTVTVNPLPTPTITPSGPTSFCQGGSVTLTASAASSYLWSNGATTQSITVNVAGNYSVTVTNGNGCQGTSAATAVAVNPVPTPTITPSGSTSLCQGGSVMLTASAASSYLWSNGATTQSITVNAAGNYSVIVTNSNGCQGTSATTTVTVNAPPSATITAPATVCLNATGLTASVPDAGAGASYSWTITNGTITGGTSTRNLTFSVGTASPVTLSVTASNASGCSASTNKAVVVSATQGAPPAFNPLPNGTVGTLYQQPVATPPVGSSFNYTVSFGSLPPGLSLNTTTGELTGTPTTVGLFNFKITATGVGACSSTSEQAYTVQILCPTIAVSPGSLTAPTVLPQGAAGVEYTTVISAVASPTSTMTGFTFILTSGALPSGLSLNPNTGVISGKTNFVGTSNFTIRATATGGSGCFAERAYRLVTACPTIALGFAANPPTPTVDVILPSGTVNTAYNRSLTAAPTGTTYIYTRTAGNFPPGLSLNATTGALTGTPPASAAGITYSFTIRAQGFGLCMGTQQYKLTINSTSFARAAVVHDFDGDGKSDRWSWRPDDGRWLIQQSSNGALGLTRLGSSRDLAVPADYDGDSKADVAVYDAVQSRWQIVYSTTGEPHQADFGAAGAHAYPADFDGDGKADLAVRTANGEWHIRHSTDDTVIRFALGAENDQAVLGDFDGDGLMDVAAYRDGHWLIRHSHNGQVDELTPSLEATADSQPLAADFDGDGVADLALRTATRLQFVSSRDGQRQTILLNTKAFVLGDYDGDGRTDVLLVAASNSSDNVFIRYAARNWEP